MADEPNAEQSDHAEPMPDDREPSSERQAELRAAYQANVAAERTPYQSVTIRTLGELRWVMQERDWSGEDWETRLVMGTNDKASADLRGANLENADLTHVNLAYANLSDANLNFATLATALLEGANLAGALLVQADLRSSVLNRANMSNIQGQKVKLSRAILGVTDLAGAQLDEADLTEAYAIMSNFSGANLTMANLSAADLSESRMDASTRIGYVKLDARTRLGDVAWNGVPFAQVDWDQLPRLGDEQPPFAATPKTRRDRIRAYRTAARAYRGLSVALRGQGLLIPASNYRLREQVLERKASFHEGKLLGWVFSWLLFLIAGYGERPARSFAAYLLVLGGFAGAYFAATNGLLGFAPDATQVQPLHWYEALVLSVSSFHGRGFFQPLKSLGDPVAILAAGEAVLGLFIEIIFIATFTQRFFGTR